MYQTSSRQQETSKVVKGKIVSSQESPSLKFQDKREIDNPSGQPNLDQDREFRQSAKGGLVFQLKSSLNHQKQRIGKKANKDNELVKHMSNLPGYLQQVEKGKNHQEKALNFGVLDWKHLEKWNCNQKHVLQRNDMNTPSSGSNSTSLSGSSSLFSSDHSKILAPQRKETPLDGSHLNSSHEEALSQGIKHSQGKGIQLQDFETAPKSTLDGQRNLLQTQKYFGRNSAIKMERVKGRDPDQLIASEKETSSFDLRQYGSSHTAKDSMSAHDGETRQKSELQASEFNLSHEHCPGKHYSVVRFFPKHSPKKSCSEVFQLSGPRISFDEKLTQDDFSSEGFHSSELSSEISNSSTLSAGMEANTESDMKPCSLIGAQNTDLPPNASHMCPYSIESQTMLSNGEPLDENKANIKPSSSNETETSKRYDAETAGQGTARGRHPSPNRRFAFSLGRMSRSFSFKEGLTVPKSSHSTVNSGQVSSKTSDCLDSANGKEINAHSRARTSPLRRLLDPLLKPKVVNPHLSAESVQPLKENLNSCTSWPINSTESFQQKKHEASTVEALLQLTFKKGSPLFKLVVGKNSDILAAAVKKFSSGKDDSSWIYTFYSVREIKKKGCGWINKELKGESCGFGYDVVGQMKVSSSCFLDLATQSSKDQFAVKEFVLYSVDHGQKGQETPEFMPNKELAAIVIKIPSENSNKDGEQSNKVNNFAGKGLTYCLQEDGNSCKTGANSSSKSTTVILPGGVHGLPNWGVPSPLINRWRSGGSCDCGGWDVGCKLRILTNQAYSCKHLGSSRPCSTNEELDLFLQGQEDRPIFSLALFKEGIYSVEFNASVSLLQAFAISIAFVSSQKSSEVMEVHNLSDTKLSQESGLSGFNGIESPTIGQREVPAKYFPCPPPSPVGRV
ncbi:uncharacterized protein LOC132293604 [Cornus florida]|uniref:uncharacterized protein LOC132293604 n=1 Tax=Cornus florida TaxID=4283 RepID=UPI0028A030ED|nr:uncharacterized protein LOC132293604 [Cornus florida]